MSLNINELKKQLREAQELAVADTKEKIKEVLGAEPKITVGENGEFIAAEISAHEKTHQTSLAFTVDTERGLMFSGIRTAPVFENGMITGVKAEPIVISIEAINYITNLLIEKLQELFPKAEEETKESEDVLD